MSDIEKKFVTLEKLFEDYFLVQGKINSSGILEGEDEDTKIDYDLYDDLNETRETIVKQIKKLL